MPFNGNIVNAPYFDLLLCNNNQKCQKMEVWSSIEAFVGRRLSVDDDDDSNSSRTTTAQLVNTVYINIFLFLVLVALFEILRRKRSIYLNRYVKRYIETNRVPDAPSLMPLAWIGKILRVSEHEILEMVGLDGYMCIRFIVICFRTACFCSFWSLLILVPVYSSTTGSASKVGWDRFTIANVPQDPSADRLWAPVFLCYLFSGFFCQLMYIEYKNFVGKRVQYLVSGDSDTPAQTYYTVMVERVPAALKSGPMLAGFFERLYPGEFHSAEIAMDLHDLELVSAKRKRVRNKLEKFIALCWANRQRPVVWKRPVMLPDFPEPVAENTIARKLGYEVVDAIEFYSKELSHLNKQVDNMQRTHFDQRQRVDEIEELRLVQIKRRLEDHTFGALHQVGSRFAGLIMRDAVEKPEEGEEDGGVARGGLPSIAEEETLTQLTDKRRNSFLHLLSTPKAKKGNSQAQNTESATWITAGVDVEDGTTKQERKSRENSKEDETTATTSRPGSRNSKDSTVEGRRNWPILNESRHASKMISNAAKSGVEGIAKEGAKTAEFAAKGALRGVLEATRALELLTFGAQYRVSSTAFVTFKSRVAKCSSHQMLLSHEYYSMEVLPAPNPNDIVWENVSIPMPQIKIRKGIADGTLIVGALFWSIVVTFISAISNLESISRVIPSLQQYSNTDLYQFANNYLAIGLLLILLAILPFIFDFIARNYEGLKTESEIQNSIMTRYFYYLLANVYVSVGLGSIATSLHEILASPASILSILGASVPSFSIYFANFVIIKTFTAVPVEMLRIFPLLDILSVSMCMDKRRCTRRELRTGAFADPPMLYGWIYPNLMMILMIMLTYNCIAPFLMPICALYFGLAYLMYKYQLLYVYINSYQSGGFMWYAVFNRSMVALIAGVLTLLCYLAIRMTFVSGPFYLLLPLPVLIGLFWHHCEKRIRTPSTTLSMEGAMELDEEVRIAASRGERTPHSQFSTHLFRQPSLNEGKLKPSLYRKGKPMLPEDVSGSRPENFMRTSTIGSGSHASPRSNTLDSTMDIEAPPSPKPARQPDSPLSPLHSQPSSPHIHDDNRQIHYQSPISSPIKAADEVDDDFDAEDAEKDVDAAVNDLLQDENTRRTVNAVSEGISAIRRSSLIGVSVHGMRASSGEAMHGGEDGPHMKLKTFPSRDRESLAGTSADPEDPSPTWHPFKTATAAVSPPPTQPLLKGFTRS